MDQTSNLGREEALTFLRSIGQGHLLENIDKFSEAEVNALVDQVNRINNNYPGGLSEYVNRGKKLLKDSYEAVNPYEGYEVHVPTGESVSLDEPSRVEELENLGVEDLGKVCFALVAGGLGERLGYDGIKVGIPIDLVTKQTFLEYYCNYVLTCQQKYANKGDLIPFAIMTSDDTHALTVKILQENDYFGLNKDQISLLKQEKIPALLDNEARFAQVPGSLLIDTKPHGHGDIHTVLYVSGLVQKWTNENRQWLFIFQDTNPLSLRALPTVLGVSKKHNLEMNSITVPRKVGEAVGAICELRHQDGRQLTINVEYNQLESLMKTVGGEKVDAQGYSVYPGNINSLLFQLPQYNKVLQETKGLIAEFINPKYADSSRTKFKTPTRLECMMQDYPKLLGPSNKVGFTQISRNFCFSTCKNDLATAKQKYQQNLALECAGSCEADFYSIHAQLLRLAGAEIEGPSDEQTFQGIGYRFGPQIVLSPSFGLTLSQIKSRIKGPVMVTKNSSLVLKGEMELENVSVDGVLRLEGNGKFSNIVVNDQKYHQYLEVDPTDKSNAPYLRIRGFTLR